MLKSLRDRLSGRKEPPAELAPLIEELNALDLGEVTYYDLRDPWLTAP